MSVRYGRQRTRGVAATKNQKYTRDSGMSSRRRKVIGGRYSVQYPAIGAGSFAKVYKAIDIENNTQVAIKAIDRSKISHNRKLTENLEKEIMVMKRLHHDNIIKLLDVISDPSRILLVMEFCEGKDLAFLMRQQGPFSEIVTQGFLRQLAAGLACMRRENLVHRDLSKILLCGKFANFTSEPQNLLLSSLDINETLLKIADFGFARPIEQESMIATLCGSPLYMAPEILREELYGVKADLWSVGVILYEMLCGDVPFPAVNTRELKRKIETTRHKIPEKIQLSAECRNLLDGLLQRDPHKRINFSDFFNHPFVRDPNLDEDDLVFDFELLDFDELETKQDVVPEVMLPQNFQLKNMRFLGVQERHDVIVLEVRKAVAIATVAESRLVNRTESSSLMFGMDGLEEFAVNVTKLALYVQSIKILKGLLKAAKDLVNKAGQTVANKRLEEYITLAQGIAEVVELDSQNFEDPEVECIEKVIYDAALKMAANAAVEETMGDTKTAFLKYKDATALLLFLMSSDQLTRNDKQTLEKYMHLIAKRSAGLEP